MPQRHDFWSTLILLLLILDPLGNLPMFLAVTRHVDPARRTWVSLRETGIAYLVLLLFMAVGRRFLELLGLGQSSLQVAGGMILLLVAIKMIFAGSEAMFGDPAQGEPLIFPLAVPLLAGPSALAAVLLLGSGSWQAVGLHILALSAAMAITALVLLLADKLLSLLGDAVLRAAEKLMGLILSAIAIDMLMRGLVAYLAKA